MLRNTVSERPWLFFWTGDMLVTPCRKRTPRGRDRADDGLGRMFENVPRLWATVGFLEKIVPTVGRVLNDFIPNCSLIDRPHKLPWFRWFTAAQWFRSSPCVSSGAAPPMIGKTQAVIVRAVTGPVPSRSDFTGSPKTTWKWITFFYFKWLWKATEQTIAMR